MPPLKYVEDTATWWKILRNGYTAYGIKDVFSYYRRMPNTSSSNKVKALRSLWNLYRKEEKLNVFYASYCFIMKNINAIKRRLQKWRNNEKVGICTLFTGYNYGSSLQAFALKKTIDKLGYDPIIFKLSGSLVKGRDVRPKKCL